MPCRFGRPSTCAAANAFASCRATIAAKWSSATIRRPWPGAWSSKGAECLHLVDLDGARDGQPVESGPAFKRFWPPSKVPCELGGGIRDETTIERLLEHGPRAARDRHTALREPDWFREHVPRAVPADWCWESTPATGTWRPTAGWKPAVPPPRILPGSSTTNRWRRSSTPTSPPTACSADRTCRQCAECSEAVELPVIASGGVTTADDVAALAAIRRRRLHHRPRLVRKQNHTRRGARRRRRLTTESQRTQRTPKEYDKSHCVDQQRNSPYAQATTCRTSATLLFAATAPPARRRWPTSCCKTGADHPAGQRRRRHQRLRFRRRRKSPQVHDRIGAGPFRPRRQALQS